MPFITFFPAIIVAAAIGGVGPGLCAVILSVVAADYFFMPPCFAFSFTWADLIALSLFAVIAAFDVFLVALLNEAIERLARQEQNWSNVLTYNERAPTPSGLCPGIALGASRSIPCAHRICRMRHLLASGPGRCGSADCAAGFSAGPEHCLQRTKTKIVVSQPPGRICVPPSTQHNSHTNLGEPG